MIGCMLMSCKCRRHWSVGMMYTTLLSNKKCSSKKTLTSEMKEHLHVCILNRNKVSVISLILQWRSALLLSDLSSLRCCHLTNSVCISYSISLVLLCRIKANCIAFFLGLSCSSVPIWKKRYKQSVVHIWKCNSFR